MNLFFKNRVYRWLTVSEFLNNSGSSIYNIVFVIFASMMPNPRFMVSIANIVMLIPIFFQISVGIQADKVKEKIKWAIRIGYAQALLFILVAVLQRNMSYLAFASVCLINVISDSFSNLERGLKMPIIQKHVAEKDMFEAFSFKQFITYISALLGQIFGVWLLSISHQSFSLVAFVNAITFLLSTIVLMLIPKETTLISATVADQKKVSPIKKIASILSNTKKIFGDEGDTDFTKIIACIILVNVLSSAILPIFNVFLVDHPMFNLPFGTTVLILQSAFVIGVILGSLLPNDFFSKMSLTMLISLISIILMSISILNMVQVFPLLSVILIAFIGYVIGKINPKLSSQLLTMLSPEVLAQTGAFLDTLFMVTIPVGTVIFTSLSLWDARIAWLSFFVLAILVFSLTMLMRSGGKRNEKI